MLFIKSFKILGLSVVMLPILGCAIGTGIIFASLIRSITYAPDMEESLLNFTILGFAFVESFAFLLLGMAIIIIAF